MIQVFSVVLQQSTLYNLLHDGIVNGRYEPSQRLKPDDLAKDYGYSASTIREVLFRLSTVGLVDFQEQRGFRVPAVSPERRGDLTQFRIMLECEGTCLSIRFGGLEWESQLSAAHHKLSHIERHLVEHPADNDSPDVLALWTAGELEFHQTLISACGSDVLKRTHAVIYQQFRQQLITEDREFVFLPENIDQHKEILDAALDHDEKAVRKKITGHLARNLAP